MSDKEIICDGSIIYKGAEVPHVIISTYTDNQRRLVLCLQSQNNSILISSRGILPEDLGGGTPIYEIIHCPGWINSTTSEYVVTSSTRMTDSDSCSLYIKNNRKLTISGNGETIHVNIFTNDDKSMWSNQDWMLMSAEEYSNLDEEVQKSIRRFACEESKRFYLIQEYTGDERAVEVGYLYTRRGV